MLDKIFYFKDIDSKYIIHILGITLIIKHKNNCKYLKADSYGLNQEKREPQIIISLTSHPGRIDKVHIAINSLLRQSVKPDKLILWLAEDEFPNKENDLPEELLKLKEFGLTIDFCEAIKNYKKMIPTLRKYPEDIIITVDDDIYYDADMVKILYNAYLKNPKNIYARRVIRTELKNSTLKRLTARDYGYKNILEASFLNYCNGAAGILYPPHSLYKDAINPSKTILNDDFYFWAMAVLNHTKIQQVGGFDIKINIIEDTQGVSFASSSPKTPQEWLNMTVEEYPQVIEIIKNDMGNME